jgi:hypothetical protein
VYEPDDKAEKEQRATERGERVRAELLALLRQGPAMPADLLPQLDTGGVSLSEVAFQLDRLAVEGRAVGGDGEAYQLP